MDDRSAGWRIGVNESARSDDVEALKARLTELEARESEHQRSEKLQAALYRIAETASAAQDMQEFYSTIHSIIRELMYADNFYIALYDADRDCAAEANIAKLVAADASWSAANMCVETHGGFGFAEDFDIGRKFREPKLDQRTVESLPESAAALGVGVGERRGRVQQRFELFQRRDVRQRCGVRHADTRQTC